MGGGGGGGSSEKKHHQTGDHMKKQGVQGVQELFFCELKGFGDSRIKSMTSKMFY